MKAKDKTNHAASRNNSSFLWFLAFLIPALGAGLYYWSATCPCDRTPGLVLLGDIQEDPVLD